MTVLLSTREVVNKMLSAKFTYDGVDFMTQRTAVETDWPLGQKAIWLPERDNKAKPLATSTFCWLARGFVNSK